MKVVSKSLLAAGMTLTLVAPILSAQTPVQFGLGGGVTIPSGSTSNGLKTGWHGTGLIQFKPVASPVGFRIDGAYQQLGFDGGGGKRQVIDGTGNVVYEFQVSPETRFRPYLIGGAGVYNLKNKPDSSQTTSATKFGINAGAGFNIQASGVGLFMEGRFHDVFVPGSDFHIVPITVGVRFGGS